jgi:hypothetical protein
MPCPPIWLVQIDSAEGTPTTTPGVVVGLQGLEEDFGGFIWKIPDLKINRLRIVMNISIL